MLLIKIEYEKDEIIMICVLLEFNKINNIFHMTLNKSILLHFWYLLV